MKDIREFLDKYVNKDLERILVSNARSTSSISKLQVRPVPVKGEVRYQVTRIQGTKAIHENYEKEELISYLTEQMKENFRQLQLEGRDVQGRVLVSKKGKADIKAREIKARAKEDFTPMLSHNRKKKYLLQEGIPVPWLVDLGVMTPEGKVRNSRYDKFKQLNRYLEFIQDILPKLPKDREIRIIDFGCGKSYLTFAMYYYLKELNHYDIQVTGLDLKTDVIEKCRSLAEKYGYEKLHFLCGDIAEYEGVQKVDMVVTLHACDKATDYALAKAVEWDAQVILSVPCCQHELNDQIQNKLLSPVLKYGLLKERMSALLTDGIRAELLESKGYSTQILEFIDMEHTPKNLLIRAVKTGRSRSGEALKEMTDAIHGHLTLEKLLYPDGFDAKEGV